MPLDLANRNVAVIGAGRSGIAAAKLLKARGAQVLVSEQRPATPELMEGIRGIDVRCEFGGNTDRVLESTLIVVSPGVPPDLPLLSQARQRGIAVIGEMELAYRCAACRMAAVTGTNGTSTTTSMIGDILKAAGLKVLVGGNLAPGRPVNELVLAADVDSVIVAEVSTFQLETVDSFRPFVGVITNITPDHLDRHPDFETYGRLKGRLLSKQGPEDTAVINGADPDVIRFAGKPMARTLLFNSGHAVTDGAWYDGQSLLMAKLGDSKTVMAASELRVPGRHNIENALAATAAASAFGVPRETMRQALAAFRGVPHRLEEVATVDGVRYINNSMCTNAAAGVQSLRALPGPLVVILGGKEKNTDLSPFLDEIAARARAAVLIGENRQRLARELGQRGLSAAVEADSLDAAVRAAAQAAAPGDVVILAPGCASYDMFRDFEDRGNQFKAAVLRLKDPGLHQQ